MSVLGRRIKKLSAELRVQLWLLPGAAALVAFVVARILVAVDRDLIGRQHAWFLFQGTSAAARELVSTIASAMITFTGVVFSITVLVLQLASGQFSPRVLRSLLGDRHTQGAMATFVATFVFALALLLSIRGSGGEVDRFVPALSVFVAFALVLASVGVFIAYIHHIAHSVRAITIISRIADDTRHAIDRMFPRVARAADLEPDSLDTVGELRDAPAAIVRSTERGALARVDTDRLFEIAREHDGLIELLPMIGDFVPTDAPVLRYWPAHREELACALDALVYERERAPEQDPLFGFRQLVDIAQRALSPGVNDPSTAVQVLDELHDLLRILSRRQIPNPIRADADGVPRLILHRPDWDAFVHLALDEIREAGSGSSQLVHRLSTLIDDCIAYAPQHRHASLRKQRALLERAVRDTAPAAAGARHLRARVATESATPRAAVRERFGVRIAEVGQDHDAMPPALRSVRWER